MYKTLFYIEHLYHRAGLDPVYRALKNSGKFKIDFLAGRDAQRKFLFFNRSLKKQIEQDIKRNGGNIAESTSGYDLVVTGDLVRSPQKFKNAMLVFINHGTGIKTILYRLLEKQQNTSYLIFVEGEYRKQKILEHDVQGKSQIEVVGYPKLDPFFNGAYDRDKILNSIGLDPDLPTLIYAPTYKPTSIDYIKDEIFSQCRDINLIIKLHQYSWRGKYAPSWHHQIYQRNIGNFKKAYLVPGNDYNIMPYLAASDVLLTEASSTMFEFLAMGKTGIIYDLPCDRLKHTDGQSILDEDNRNFLENTFIHINSPDHIKDGFNQAINPPPEYLNNAENWRKKLFYKLDGKASERICSNILDKFSTGEYKKLLI
ncbi:MAG: CDP-glycerol glycerophosphotransferase family protein [bacterium]